MSTFTTVIARTGHLEEINAHLGSPFYSIKEADTEAEAIILATEKFEQEANWDIAPDPDSIDAYEMWGSDNETVIGWEVDGMGMPSEFYLASLND